MQRTLLSCFVAVLLTASAFAGSLTVAWDPYPDLAGVGFKVYWRAAGALPWSPVPVNVPGHASTAATLPNISAGSYEVGVKAYTLAGESERLKPKCTRNA